MYERYHASKGAIAWSELKYAGRKLARALSYAGRALMRALPEIIAGIAFAAIFISLPILAGFIAG